MARNPKKRKGFTAPGTFRVGSDVLLAESFESAAFVPQREGDYDADEIDIMITFKGRWNKTPDRESLTVAMHMQDATALLKVVSHSIGTALAKERVRLNEMFEIVPNDMVLPDGVHRPKTTLLPETEEKYLEYVRQVQEARLLTREEWLEGQKVIALQLADQVRAGQYRITEEDAT